MLHLEGGIMLLEGGIVLSEGGIQPSDGDMMFSEGGILHSKVARRLQRAVTLTFRGRHHAFGGRWRRHPAT